MIFRGDTAQPEAGQASADEVGSSITVERKIYRGLARPVTYETSIEVSSVPAEMESWPDDALVPAPAEPVFLAPPPADHADTLSLEELRALADVGGLVEPALLAPEPLPVEGESAGDGLDALRAMLAGMGDEVPGG